MQITPRFNFTVNIESIDIFLFSPQYYCCIFKCINRLKRVFILIFLNNNRFFLSKTFETKFSTLNENFVDIICPQSRELKKIYRGIDFIMCYEMGSL